MDNLAGRPNADSVIEEELYLAGIPVHKELAKGEVPYTIIGKLGSWTFRRAWYYYIASCRYNLGLYYEYAIRLHEKTYPTSNSQYKILGDAIRATGDCTCPHPRTLTYPSLDQVLEEFKEAQPRHPTLDFSREAASRAFEGSPLRTSGKMKYIRLYHIDTLIGLKEFVDTISS